VALLLVAALGPGAVQVRAQGADASRIVTGDSIRLKLPGALWLDAHFGSWSADVMLLEVAGIAGDWPVSIFDLDGLQVYTQRSARDGLRHWALIGAVTGIFAGAATGLVLHATGAVGEPDAPPGQIISTALSWTGIGIVVGTLGGAAYGASRPGIGWVQVQLPIF
jgi:hypothetical protein